MNGDVNFGRSLFSYVYYKDWFFLGVVFVNFLVVDDLIGERMGCIDLLFWNVYIYVNINFCLEILIIDLVVEGVCFKF